MCQLLAMSCKEPATINFSLTGFVARGGLTDEHKDGWGIAFFRQNIFDVFLDLLPASTSALVAEINSASIKSKTIIAHIRKATVGEVKLNNCHPFQRELWGQSWLFCHNGHLKDFHPVLNGRFETQGDTDSELAFCYLLQRLEQQLPKGLDDTETFFVTLGALSREIEKFGIFNIILSNGELLFTFCSTSLTYVERQHPFTTVTLIDTDMSLDLSKHNTESDHMILVATKPLTKNEDWKVYQQGESRMFREGLVLHKSAVD